MKMNEQILSAAVKRFVDRPTTDKARFCNLAKMPSNEIYNIAIDFDSCNDWIQNDKVTQNENINRGRKTRSVRRLKDFL